MHSPLSEAPLVISHTRLGAIKDCAKSCVMSTLSRPY